jgi:hypothetical protein
MAERSKAADCKSVVVRLRRFKSYSSHTQKHFNLKHVSNSYNYTSFYIYYFFVQI